MHWLKSGGAPRSGVQEGLKDPGLDSRCFRSALLDQPAGSGHPSSPGPPPSSPRRSGCTISWPSMTYDGRALKLADTSSARAARVISQDHTWWLGKIRWPSTRASRYSADGCAATRRLLSTGTSEATNTEYIVKFAAAVVDLFVGSRDAHHLEPGEPVGRTAPNDSVSNDLASVPSSLNARARSSTRWRRLLLPG